MPDSATIKAIAALIAALVNLVSDIAGGKKEDVPKRISAIWMQNRSEILRADAEAKARNRFKA